MKYVIMCGGKYHYWKYPKQLSMINGETLIERTIRLLKEAGVKKEDICITASAELADILLEQAPSVKILMHYDPFESFSSTKSTGYWVDCFPIYMTPTTYLMGDVVFSPEAIKTIVETKTDDIEFFASAPPFAQEYSKEWAEPFAFKVVNQAKFQYSIHRVKWMCDAHAFKRHPIAWELWQVIKGTPINVIDYTNYTAINDYTCDVDKPADIYHFEGGSEWHTT